MTIELTGLSYADWEQRAARLDQLVQRAEKTGLLDANHVTELDQVEDDVSDELMVVDDVRHLSDPHTAVQLLTVRKALGDLQERLRLSRLRMKQLLHR